MNFLDETDADAATKKELFRVAAEHKLIVHTEKWFEYLRNRNKTSHIYDAATAATVFKAAVEFLEDAKKLYSEIEARND
jgi:nucleotidyltransferase substrate binding protein (TIGR01987 family)